MNNLIDLIKKRVDPDELIDVLEISTEELVDVFEYLIIKNSDKFDYLIEDIEED